MEWPPRSGNLAEFPEADRGDWFSLGEAQERILASQQQILNLLARALDIQT
jgi:predicted NUDIX family NTP pyrophosphohydrolase